MSTPRQSGSGIPRASAPSTGPRMPTDRSLPMLPGSFSGLSRVGPPSSTQAYGTSATGLGITDENAGGMASGPLSARTTAARPAVSPPDAFSSMVSAPVPPQADHALTQELERKLRDARRESLELRSRLAGEMGTLQREGQRTRAELEKAEETSGRLKEDRDFLHAAHTALTAQLAERQKAHTDLKASADAAASNYRRETSALKDQVADLTAKLTQTIAQTSNKDARWSADRANLEARAKAAEEQARKSTEAAKAGIAERGQLAAKVEQLQRELRDERAKSGRGDEADIIARQLKEQQPYIASLKQRATDLAAENNAIRSRLENAEVLKSQVESLQRDLDRTSEIRRRNDDLEREVALLKAEKTHWAAFLPQPEPGTPGQAGDRTPAGLAKRAYRAQLELALQREKAGEAIAERSVLESDLAGAESRASTASKKIADLEAALAKAEAKATRADKGRGLLNKEIELLRARCASYEMELGESPTGSAAMTAQEQTRSWETAVQGYKERVDELEKDLLALKSSESAPAGVSGDGYSTEKIRGYQNRIRELEGLVEEHKTEREMLEKQVTVLDEQVGLLERAVGRGEYDPSTTKILEMRDNPFSESQAIRQERLDKLLQENAALLAGNAVTSTVPAAAMKRAEFDLQQARKEVEEGAKRLDRLKKVFTEQAAIVRESVLKLLGWKLDADPQTSRITLRSTMSQHESHCFYFQSSPNNPAEHLRFTGSGNPDFSAALDPVVSYYVTRFGSVPSLLAWVTLEGFKRTLNAPDMLPADLSSEEEQRKRRRM